MTPEQQDAEVARERHEEYWAEPVEHVTTVERIGTWGECSPSCTCGWIGPTNYRSQAEADAVAHAAEMASCPNDADPVLCKVQPDGAFVPEAGCPRHDPDVVA